MAATTTTKTVCGAPTKSGKTCGLAPVPGRTRCRFHGGRTRVGTANGQFKHGRYSKYLPQGVRQRYEEANADPDLLSARDEVALLNARIAELAQRLHSGEAGSLWRDLQEAWMAFQGANAAGDPGLVGQTLNALHGIINQGAREEAVWSELTEAIANKSKVASQEWKRLVDLKQVMTAERVTLFTMALLDAVMRHTPEPDRRSAIALEFHRLLGPGQDGPYIDPVLTVGVDEVDSSQRPI